MMTVWAWGLLLGLAASALAADTDPNKSIRVVLQMCSACPARRLPEIRAFIREAVQGGQYGPKLTLTYARAERPVFHVYGQYDVLLGRYTVHPDTDLQKLHEMVQNWGLTHSQPTVSKAPKAVTGLDFDPFASDVNANPVTATGVNSAGAYIGSTWPTVPAELGATNFGGNAVPIVAAPAVAVATPSPAIATVPNAKPATPVAVAAVDVDTEAEAYNPGDYFVGARVPASRKGAKATGPSTTSATPAAAPAASAGDNGLAGSAFGAFAVSGSPAGVSTDAFTPSALSGSYPGAGFGGSAGLGGLGAMGTMGAGGAAGLGGLAGQGAGGLGSFGSMFGGFGGSSSLLGGASTSDSSSSSRPYPISFSGFGRRRRHM